MSEEYEYDEDEVEYYAIRPNKTQIKKEFADLFALGEEISELSAVQVKSLELPENIHKSITEVAKMPHKSARKRLLKFIAAQLHKIEVEPILEKLARIKNKSAHAVREHHIAERWRDRLIAEGDDALAELLDEQPHADRQQLRQLLRNAKKEAEAAKPPKSSRDLYRLLKKIFADGESEFNDESELDDGVDEQE